MKTKISILFLICVIFLTSGFGCTNSIDKYTQKKMRPMNQHSNINQLWGEMMLEFALEYADKYKSNQISH